MATIAEIRQQHPEYGDMGDAKLAVSLYRKFYSDMPMADYLTKVGVDRGDALYELREPGDKDGDYLRQQLSKKAAGETDEQVRERQDGSLSEQRPSGIVANIGAGIDIGANALLGAPVDFPVWVGNSLVNAGNAGIEMAGGGRPIPNIPDDLPGSRKRWERIQGDLGFTTPDEVAATTPAERLARSGAEATAMSVIPEAFAIKAGQVVQQLPRAVAAVPDALAALTGRSQTMGQFARNTAIAAGGGVGAEAAMDAAPDGWKPLAALGGGLSAAGLTHAVTELPALAGKGVQLAGRYLSPLTQGGREMLAGETLREAATSPGAALDALENAPRTLVEGSDPTTFQLTGDMGLGGLERGVSARAPAEFMARRAQQNEARLGAVDELQPGGAPEQVSNALRDRLAQIDEETYQAVEAATGRARKATEAIGEGTSANIAGGNIRASLEEARAAAKAQEDALWKAVDPDGTLTISPTNTTKRAADIQKETPASAKPPGGEEAAVYDVLRQYGDVVPFNELSALHTRLNEAMRAERDRFGDTATYRRMSQLNSAIFEDLNSGVVQRVAQEERAVTAGVMSVEQTAAHRVEQWLNDWNARKTQAAAGHDDLGAVGPVARGRTVGGGSVFGATGEARIGPRNSPRDPRLSADGPANFDRAALGRLTAAREATLDRANTFDNRTLAPIRQRPATTAPYNMGDSAVAARVFRPGQRAFDDVQALRRAIGDKQALIELRNYAIGRLRVAALREDGTLDPVKLAAWRKAHSDALRAFPALDKQLSDAGKLSEAMGEAVASRKLAIDEAQKGILGRLIGVDHPSDVAKVIGGIFSRQDSVQQMMAIRRAIGGNKEALEGLRKSVADYITERFVGNTEAGTSGLGAMRADEFMTFVRRGAPTLRAAGFSDEQVATLQRIAEDMQRANRSVSSVRLPGGSNTTQDVLAARVTDNNSSILVKLFAQAIASGGGVSLIGGPWLGVPVGLATAFTAALRQVGLSRVDDLVKEAMLSPDLARRLLIKATPGNVRLAGQTFKRSLSRSLAPSLALGAEAQ
ncbi:hypothetical protein [Devosia sp. DBB001]|nr:hypothetical protein [Devosia sp. DBB001]